MIFLLQCLWIVLVAYACGAVVSGVLMRSGEERALPAAPRALFGLLIAITWFAAAWQFLPIGQAWALGAALLALLAWRRVRIAELRASLGEHARGCAVIVAGAFLFFAPLIAANQYGPFTESGGDITIYSDGSQLMVEKGLTSFGQPPRLESAGSNLRALLGATDRLEWSAQLRERLMEEFRARINPPAAEFAARRLVADLFFSSIYYAPYAQFQPFLGALNYPAFFGVEAFFYSALLLCLWHFFRPFGRAPAAIALALAAASHALVSVYYNAYSMQAICLAIAAAFVLAATRVALASRAGLRVYGFGTLIAWLCYTHFMSILAPLVLVAAFISRPSWRPATPAAPEEPSTARPQHLAHGIALAIALVAMAALLLGGSAKAVDFASKLVTNFTLGVKSAFLGDRIAVLSWEWAGFLFGIVSQQHVPPFVREAPMIAPACVAGAVAGFAAVVLGFASMVRWAARSPAGPMPRPVALALYGALLVTVAAHIYLAQGSLYTQAKGAQNVLPCLYAALVFPLALSWGGQGRLRWALAAALCALAAALLVPRLLYGYNLGHEKDRAAVLDRSYFDEAARIRAADPQALVLFEPRKSADLYLGIQPFSGARMVPTRHLGLQRLIVEGRNLRAARTSVAELLRPEDVPHLWWLSQPKGSGTWRAQPLLEAGAPRFLVAGDDYEIAYGPRALGPLAGGTGIFSYVRNADLLLAVPAGRAVAVELRIEARDGSSRDRLMERLERDRAPGAAFSRDGDLAVIRQDLAAAPEARVVRLAGALAEYWVNARLDGVEVK